MKKEKTMKGGGEALRFPKDRGYNDNQMPEKNPMNKNCYILYCRKSTESEDRQVLSLDSQEQELRRIAERNGFSISKVFKESVSAKAPERRPLFDEMLSLIEKGKVQGILCWKLDRLARNPIDGGRIIWLLQGGVIKSIQTYEKEYLPSDNVLLMYVDLGMANQYIRDLRQNVMRGNRAKLDKGGWPNMAPFGYTNDKAARSIIVQPDTAPAVQMLFNLYASGQYNLREITKAIYEHGFRTRGGKSLSKSNIHKILQNPFYYGVMVKDGVHYRGNHEPLITKALYDEVQDVLNGTHRTKRKSHTFPLRGFMTCEICGCLLTATLQKGTYVYYYCTNAKGGCDQRKKHLKAHDAAVLVSDVLQNLVVDEAMLDIACRASEEKYHHEENGSATTRHALLKRLGSVKEQQDTLVRRKDTPDDVYGRNMAALRNEQVDLENELSKLGAEPSGTEITFEQVKNAFLEANSMARSFLAVPDERKREYAEILLSNISVRDQKAQRFQFKPAYQAIANIPKNPTIEQLCAGEDSNLHAFRRYHLKVVRLPFRHPRKSYKLNDI